MPAFGDFIHLRGVPGAPSRPIHGAGAIVALFLLLAGLLSLLGWLPAGGAAVADAGSQNHTGALALVLGAAGIYLQCVRAADLAPTRAVSRLLAAIVFLLGIWQVSNMGLVGLVFCLLGLALFLISFSSKALPAPPDEAAPDIDLAPQVQQLRRMVTQLEVLREKDKREIARQLHDEVGALLTSLNMHLEGVYPSFAQDGQGAERKLKIQALLKSLVRITRRMQSNLHPAMLDLFGLHAALNEQMDDFSEQSGIACTASLPDEEASLDRSLQMTVYRIVQDYLGVVRQAQPKAVELILDVDEDQVGIVVRDDGRRDLNERQLNATTLALCDRIQFLEGSFKLVENPQGVSLAVSIPLPRSGAHESMDREHEQTSGSP